MSKKKTVISKNYLDNIPLRGDFAWNADENGIVTLELENKGVFNKVAQVIFKKPRVSYIHLDEQGSFVWREIDGERDIAALGEAVNKQFGAEAQPLYERLAQYFRMLESYGFVKFK